MARQPRQVVTKRWITITEAAERTSLTPEYLRKMIKTGQLPPGIAHKPAGMGHWRLDVEALDQWMRNGCFTVAPDDDGGKVVDRAPA
jgi:excisionase family DNA binding protein